MLMKRFELGAQAGTVPKFEFDKDEWAFLGGHTVRGSQGSHKSRCKEKRCILEYRWISPFIIFHAHQRFVHWAFTRHWQERIWLMGALAEFAHPPSSYSPKHNTIFDQLLPM